MDKYENQNNNLEDVKKVDVYSLASEQTQLLKCIRKHLLFPQKYSCKRNLLKTDTRTKTSDRKMSGKLNIPDNKMVDYYKQMKSKNRSKQKRAHQPIIEFAEENISGFECNKYEKETTENDLRKQYLYR
ncbi:hypothetical protein HELRODRAFT_167461 [Helobdella robusta]|uniref:Uncharacterized protein n=1 Tax=Helobdella robusta TaxID=6412 RepID=T1EZE4_HELRO|nr:hypothetical protein HELRODRAFT_167461 [Helobdella robusta]ESO10947.1 hypothetical protein HELRODRAFT_167461 [Helobdella robusta]